MGSSDHRFFSNRSATHLHLKDYKAALEDGLKTIEYLFIDSG
jgi:hypothetical protein